MILLALCYLFLTPISSKMFLVKTKDPEEVGNKVEFGNTYMEMETKESKESDMLQVEYGNDYMDDVSGESTEHCS